MHPISSRFGDDKNNHDYDYDQNNDDDHPAGRVVRVSGKLHVDPDDDDYGERDDLHLA